MTSIGKEVVGEDKESGEPDNLSALLEEYYGNTDAETHGAERSPVDEYQCIETGSECFIVY